MAYLKDIKLFDVTKENNTDKNRETFKKWLTIRFGLEYYTPYYFVNHASRYFFIPT